MSTSDSLDAIVAKLTPAQRADLAHGRCIIAGNPDCLCQSTEIDALNALGLIEPSRRKLTPRFPSELGRQVRAALHAGAKV